MDSRDVAVGEYGLFRLALSWWQQRGRDETGGGGSMELGSLVSCLDFGKMTAEQVGLVATEVARQMICSVSFIDDM
jgi:hypothetical protein